jgi:hypothetical protein
MQKVPAALTTSAGHDAEVPSQTSCGSQSAFTEARHTRLYYHCIHIHIIITLVIR